MNKEAAARKEPTLGNLATRLPRGWRAVGGVIVCCALLVWAILPILIQNPGQLLTLAVTPSTDSACPDGSACYTLELRNLGPWPLTVDVKDVQVYPSVIGPSVNVNWLGAGLMGFTWLSPFAAHTFTFSINILGGMLPPDRVYVVLSANITVLYLSHSVVLHSGNR